MTGWSSLGRIFQDPKLFRTAFVKLNKNNDVLKRNMCDHGPRTMVIEGSRWQWEKFKDLLHLYTMIGALWTGLLITYCNVFIGPAQLAPIPEGYEPKHWEYHRHPITRFIARYMHPSPQQDYEKYLHVLSEQKEKQWTKMVFRDIQRVEGARKDFKGSFYHYVPADHVRVMVDNLNDALHHRKPTGPEQF